MKSIGSIVRTVVKVITGVFLAYAVIFSIAGTTAIIAAACYVAAPILEVKKLATHNPAETAFMRATRRAMHDARISDTLRQHFIPIDSISPALVRAVVAAEDDGFYTHPGFDLVAILTALEYNQSVGKNKRGASTLTQQLAKNLFLSGDRSFKRKYMEFAYTVLLEYYLGKKRILELYLNYAQWGPNIFGCEAAARKYFGKSAAKLSFSESARMAATLAMPCRINPNSSESVFMGKRFVVIANNMYRRKQIDSAGYFDLTGQYPADTLNDTTGGKQPARTEESPK